MNIKAPLNTLLGYGAASWNIAKALHESGEPIALFPIGQPYLTTGEEQLMAKLINERYDYFDIDKSSLTIYHENMLYDPIYSRKETIGFPFFEIDVFDMPRIKCLECVDRIFVTSKWGETIIRNAGINSPINIVPLGVDTNIFFPSHTKNEPYKFFTIGKIEKRKCTDLLPAIMDHAFTESDNVELHVMCDSPLPQIKQQMPYFMQMYQNSPLGSKIFIHNLKKTDYDLAHFIQGMDCGIFLTRAEGWGLPILQSLSCGKPIIVTDYSAQMEFCNKDNAMLVNVDKLEPAVDNLWFFGQGNWAQIGESQLEQTVEYMRLAYKNRLRYNANGVKTASEFTWKNTAEKIKCIST